MNTPVARRNGLREFHRRKREARDRAMAWEILDYTIQWDACFPEICDRFPHATLRVPDALELASK